MGARTPHPERVCLPRAGGEGRPRRDTCAIVVAGGSGERFGDPRGKQFVDLAGMPLMCWSVAALDRCPSVARLVVVCAPDRVRQVEEDVLSRLSLAKPVALAPSGETRQGRCSRASPLSPAISSSWRSTTRLAPFVEVEQVEACIAAVRADEALAGAILASRSHGHAQARGRREDRGHTRPLVLLGGADPPRSSVAGPSRRAQGCGPRRVPRHRRCLPRGAHGRPVRVVESTRDNIKVTLPEDLALAEATLERRLLT